MFVGMSVSMSLPVAPAAGSPSPRRRPPWMSPAGQPAYARPVLLVIAAVAAVLFTWDLDRSVYHVFYATAVRSMTQSPLAFLFGSFDPGNSITLDKLPMFLWPQAISAFVFGFHPWVLVLPQAVEGVLCVLVLYKVVRRWAGVVPALVAAAFLTLTPVTVGLGRSIVEDSLFTLLLVLAAEAVQRAVQQARLRILLLAAVYVGLAFQTKMVEAWAVLPALALTYLVAAPISLRRRIGHVALAGVVTGVLSASWILIATLTPPSQRPYVDGTTNNSALSMVVGYNFLNRFASLGFNASTTGSVIADQQSTRP
ncbi:MAG: mannosyltransferase, partial [Sphaerisporangium sp.]|nr:mannosyltransferase [Sphaerisporangium sp.]